MEYIDQTYGAQCLKEYFNRHGSLPAHVIEFLIEKYEYLEEVEETLSANIQEAKACVQSEDVLQGVKDLLLEAKAEFPPKVKDKTSLTLIESAISDLDQLETQFQQDGEYQLERLSTVSKMLDQQFKVFEPSNPFHTKQ
jgi:hypothetical protein